MLKAIAKTLKRAGVATGLVMAVAFAGPTNAATFVGDWDPPLPSPFTGLSWRGTVFFDIDNSCLAGTGVVSSCSNWKITSATVEFFPTSGGLNAPATDTIKWDTPDGVISSIEVTNGALTAVYGSFNYYVKAQSPATSLVSPYWFTLAFQGPQDNKGIINNYAYLQWCKELEYSRCGGFECEHAGNSGKPTAPQTGSFLHIAALNVVPEPGSLALMLPALGMLAVFRRRKTEG